MLTALLVVALLAGFFLAFGRSGPGSDRPALRSLTATQLALAVLHGMVVFARVHERRRTGRAGGYDEPLCRARSTGAGAGNWLP